jgi:hypothetical protein
MKPHGHDTVKHLISVLENTNLCKGTPEGSEQQIADSLNKNTITKIFTMIKKIEQFEPCL